MENTPSHFAPLRNAKGFGEVMEFLAQENTAAIIEALRSEKWARQLFPLYIGHKNHIVRYEIACSAQASEVELKSLMKDNEMIVRQAAKQNLMARQKPNPVLNFPVKKEEKTPEAPKENQPKENKKGKKKKQKQKDKKNE